MLINTLLSLLRGYHVDLGTVAAQVISILFVILCILPLHELAHAWVANKLGDPTAKLEGRLTFNPLASVDPMGALALLLFGFGWAKPVPVDSRYFRKPKRDMAITALAGPVSNLLAAFVGAVLVAVMEAFSPYNGFTNFVYNVLWYYVVVNISLAVFNLIPMPPLDGSRIVAAFLSDRAMYTYYRYQNLFVMVMFLLLLSGALSGPLATAQTFFANIIFSLARAPFQLFGLL
ncbi:MAG: site-2 protease family protein [Acutalibacter sp.]|mgnify:FL=1|uniref:site-2 protease family protein n=1 Tax=Acutalibacter sp. LFL-21 TaxID=2983399 RepID=UPI0015B9B449|nr:site-2 protease family protein [Acutalibacter sp. LFL-21]MCU7653150.1 site-2 protease family protein [Acutalibacter sp. LFL-21]HIW24314.1 site-2 protease family protein [Candidatus Acutalibacter stercoravium]